MGHFVDYKATVWGRLHFDDSVDVNQIIQKLEEGYLPAELCDVEELKFKHFHFMDDTEEFITPVENDGQSTIEVYGDDECIWDNSFESELERKRNGMEKMFKKQFVEGVLYNIRSKNKLALIKLVKDTSRNPKNGISIGLKECKEFINKHYEQTEECAEILWKFAKGKLKN